MNLLSTAILLFFAGSVVNVILATIKSIITAKSESKFVVSMANAISYGFYAIIIQQMVHYSVEITVAVTLLSNFIGVTLSMYLLDWLKKDKVWKISVTVLNPDETGNLMNELEEKGLSFSRYDIYNKHSDMSGIDIYSQNKKQSEISKEILSNYNVKYHVLEVRSQL